MKVIYLLVFALIPFLSSAQLVTEKELKDSSYGVKKLKKAPKKVYINQFFINYQLLSSGSTQSVTGKTSAEMAVGLKGMEIADFQLITNNAYAKVVKKLTDAGFEIVDADEAQKTEMLSSWQRMSGGKPSKAQMPGYVTTAPKGLDFFAKRVSKKGKAKGTFFDSTPKLSKELGDIPVFEAGVNFQFVTIEGSSSYLMETSKMKGKVNFEMAYGTNARIVWKGGAPGAGAIAIAQVAPKKNIAIPGVVETKKFKEYVAPSINYASYYSGFLTEVGKDVNVTHMVNADRDAYIQKTQQALDEYFEYFLNAFIANANK